MRCQSTDSLKQVCLSIHCSAHAHSTPLLLLLLLRRLPTPWAWCCNGHTHTNTHTRSPPTCPHAHRRVNTHAVKGQSGFLLSVLQPSPHSSVEHTVQRVSWHLGRYHSYYQPNNQLNVQEHTIWWPRRGMIIQHCWTRSWTVRRVHTLLPVLGFQAVLASLSLLQLSLHLCEFLPVGLLLDTQHLVFTLQTHHGLPVGRKEENEETGGEGRGGQMKRVREW